MTCLYASDDPHNQKRILQQKWDSNSRSPDRHRHCSFIRNAQSIFTKYVSLYKHPSYARSILYKSIAGRYRPVSYSDGTITARYKNAYWDHWGICLDRFLKLSLGSPPPYLPPLHMERWLQKTYT